MGEKRNKKTPQINICNIFIRINIYAYIYATDKPDTEAPQSRPRALPFPPEAEDFRCSIVVDGDSHRKPITFTL